MPLSDSEISAIVGAEEDDAVAYRNEIGKKRKLLMDYYNQKPYGDEVEGRSRFVSSDVADVVEGMLPSLVRAFTQGRHVARWEADQPEFDQEAEQKTELVNYVFSRQNDGVLVLHNMFKDALLQYTGTVKVSWREHSRQSVSRYSGLSELEFNKLRADSASVDDVEQSLSDVGIEYSCVATSETTTKKVDYDNIPPEEFVISRNARDFVNPRLIGHISPKTRSELIEMGFDREVVDNLPRSSRDASQSSEGLSRDKGAQRVDANPTMDPSLDEFDLAEYYMRIDVDEDGIAELWQIFKVDNTILSKERWDEHPFAVCVPVPIPHRAIGSCPGEQVADLQLTKSVLVRQGLDNIYNTNWQRMAYNDRVDLDDLFTPRPGGGIHIEGEGDVSSSLQPITTIPQVDGVLQFIEYVDTAREVRSGVTRYNQGMDTDSLNKTATGFRGIMDASLQRMDLIARIFAETGVRDLFRKTANVIAKYQDTATQIRVTGEPMEIDPTSWRENLDCRVIIGAGSADRIEKLAMLQQVYERQKEALQLGLPLADPAKMFHTLDRLAVESGLHDGDQYFVDPAQPADVLQFENFQLKQQLAQATQNPLAEAEQVKAQGRLQEQAIKESVDFQKFMIDQARKQEEFEAEQRQKADELATKLTELELKFRQDVPGSAV